MYFDVSYSFSYPPSFKLYFKTGENKPNLFKVTVTNNWLMCPSMQQLLTEHCFCAKCKTRVENKTGAAFALSELFVWWKR